MGKEFINVDEIGKFYNHYKNSISTIKKLEKKLLKETYSYQKWAGMLQEKSQKIRQLYQENQDFIKNIIQKISDPSQYCNLTDEIAHQFISHIDFFLSEGYRDYQVVVPVLDVLIPYYTERNQVPYLFDCCYFKALAILNQNEYKEAQEYFNKALSLYPELSECKEDYRLFRIMCCYYYRLLAAVCEENINQKKLLKYQRSALDIWTIRVPVTFLTDKKSKAITSILRGLTCFSINRLLEEGRTVDSKLWQFIEEEYQQQNQHYGNPYKVQSKIFVLYHKYEKCQGVISQKEYLKMLTKKFEEEKENNSNGFEYGEMDFVALFDDEFLDEDFAAEKLSYMNPSYTYIYYLIPELIKNFGDSMPKNREDEIFLELKRYYSGMPIISGDFLLDYGIELHIKQIFRYQQDFGVSLKLLEIIYVVRQVMTVIHSAMVSKLAGVMTSHFVCKAPELFVGQCGTRSAAEVLEKQEEIITFAENAGKCHDFGKIICSDIINLQSRSITDKEFASIKKHSAKGGELLNCIPALKKFSDIAVFHHKSYDGYSGYPENVDNTASPYKIFIDIITLCDCIDAATDSLGRNYAKTKNFGTVLEEFIRDKGARYNGDLVELLKEDQELKEKIDKLTTQERESVYYEIYQNFIEPEAKFRPKDEKFVRKCRESDLEKIVGYSKKTQEEQLRLFWECEKMSYIVVDGYGTIYGSVFAKEAECIPGAGKERILQLMDITIDKKFRRHGYGSMLLAVVQEKAKKEAYQWLLIPEVMENHHDKFCWRNGFVKSQWQGFMIKQITVN